VSPQYKFEGGGFRFSDQPSRKLDQVSLAFDLTKGTVLKHGSPQEVLEWARGRTRIHKVGGGLEVTLFEVGLMTFGKGFPVEYLNKALGDPTYLKSLVGRCAPGAIPGTVKTAP
jgi:hypothetical protein